MNKPEDIEVNFQLKRKVEASHLNEDRNQMLLNVKDCLQEVAIGRVDTLVLEEAIAYLDLMLLEVLHGAKNQLSDMNPSIDTNLWPLSIVVVAAAVAVVEHPALGVSVVSLLIHAISAQ